MSGYGRSLYSISLIRLFIYLLLLGLVSCDSPRSGETQLAPDSAEVAMAEAPVPTEPEFQEVMEPTVNIDFPKIRKSGKLVALTGYSASSYFIYKGEPLGFEYELLQLLAKRLDLELEIVIVRNLDRIFSMLNTGEGDIVAYNMTITKTRKQAVDFTNHHTLIRQVLVQRMPENYRQLKRHQIERLIITSPTDLIGKEVHVRKGSSYYHRLNNLADEIGGDIDIVEVPGDVSTEELIARVASGEIEYTVADENVAQINAAYHHNLDISMPVSLPQRIAWAVRKNSPLLKAKINKWLKEMKYEPTFNVLYAKYHRNKRFYTQRVRSEFFSMTGDKISPYDELIKQHAEELNWDWRLLASQIFQESEFDPDARSWVGASGLMQLMPATARQFGAIKIKEPTQNIAAGTRYLNWLQDYWSEIPDSLDRLKFVLASYNTGQGHVQDARRLAIKYGKDPLVWNDNVEYYLLRKSQKKYFNDDVVRFGYCRGEEPVNYVREILERYDHYINFTGPKA